MERVIQCLKERIFTPYLNCHFWWMGDGVSHMNNWTIWSTQNVLMAAALWEEDETIRQQILLKAAKSATTFWRSTGQTAAATKAPSITATPGSASLIP